MIVITEQDVVREGDRTVVVNQAWRPHQITLADAETVKTEVLLEKPKRFVHEQLRMPAGEMLDWYYTDTPASVMVVPVLSDGQFVMVYQYRHNLKRYTLEFPAGEVAEAEEPEDAAQRELAEETGFALAGMGAMHPLGTYYSSPSETNKITHIFLARPVAAAGPAVKDAEIERWFGMSAVMIHPGHAVDQIGKSVGGTETITALMLARKALDADSPQ